MKKTMPCLMALMALGAALATGAHADANVPGTQGYVNSEINRMVMNRAILRQATGGRSHRAGRHAAKHPAAKHPAARHAGHRHGSR